MYKRKIISIKLIFIALLLNQVGLANDNNTSTLNPILKEFDTNRDGKLFYSEASEDLQEHFCQYDVNQDGYLDKKEIKEVPKKFAKAKKTKT